MRAPLPPKQRTSVQPLSRNGLHPQFCSPSNSPIQVAQLHFRGFLKLEPISICCFAPSCLGVTASRGGCVLLEDGIFRELPGTVVNGRVPMLPAPSPLQPGLNLDLPIMALKCRLSGRSNTLKSGFNSSLLPTFNILPSFYSFWDICFLS